MVFERNLPILFMLPERIFLQCLLKSLIAMIAESKKSQNDVNENGIDIKMYIIACLAQSNTNSPNGFDVLVIWISWCSFLRSVDGERIRQEVTF